VFGRVSRIVMVAAGMLCFDFSDRRCMRVVPAATGQQMDQ
jgi:hypothetical protein